MTVLQTALALTAGISLVAFAVARKYAVERRKADRRIGEILGDDERHAARIIQQLSTILSLFSVNASRVDALRKLTGWDERKSREMWITLEEQVNLGRYATVCRREGAVGLAGGGFGLVLLLLFAVYLVR